MATFNHCYADKLSGDDADGYVRDFLRRVADKQGWTQLWVCSVCDTYWEMTWEGGGGFDDGVLTLRRLSTSELSERWGLP